MQKTLEKDIRSDMHVSTINIADVHPVPNKTLIKMVGARLEKDLATEQRRLKPRFLFWRTFEQLSDEQKYHYKISKMMEGNPQFWIMDEFAATLNMRER